MSPEDKKYYAIDRMLGQSMVMKVVKLTNQQLEYILNHLDGISLIIHGITRKELE